MKNKINPQPHHSQGTVLLVHMKEIWSQNLNLISLCICKTQISWRNLRGFFPVTPLKIVSLLLIYLKFPGTRISRNLCCISLKNAWRATYRVSLFFPLLSPTLISAQLYLWESSILEGGLAFQRSGLKFLLCRHWMLIWHTEVPHGSWWHADPCTIPWCSEQTNATSPLAKRQEGCLFWESHCECYLRSSGRYAAL